MRLQRGDSAEVLLGGLETQLFDVLRVDIAVIEVANALLVGVQTILPRFQIGEDGANLVLALNVEIEEGTGIRPIRGL